MREQGWGRVINMTSNTLQLALPWGFAPYVASKGAIVGLTRALATEYGPHGITVNAISPGLTKTPGTTELFGDGTGAMAQAQAIKRPEVPEDLVGTLAFLASDDAAFITGQTITVDGGLARL
jgi:NAD(P)-dependent dehydrogenase (short-subunit alcohol dehydrogenase family)